MVKVVSEEKAYALAAAILARFGTSPDEASRPLDGESNLVWLTEELALRVSGEPGPGHLRREAALVYLLPPEVGYPRVVAHGTEDGHEWMATERLPGQNLGRAWPELAESARADAVEDLWHRLRAVQGADVDRASELGATETPFYLLDRQRAAAQLDGCLADGLVNDGMHDWLTDALSDGFEAMSQIESRLSHTDAGAHNTIWDGTQAVPIDFEFACVAPCDLDLDQLLRGFLETPQSAAGERLIELSALDLARSGAKERIIAYGVLREIWALRLWAKAARRNESVDAEAGWPPKDLDDWRPWKSLASYVAGSTAVQTLW